MQDCMSDDEMTLNLQSLDRIGMFQHDKNPKHTAKKIRISKEEMTEI